MQSPADQLKRQRILEGAVDGIVPPDEELEFLLASSDADGLTALYTAGRQIRQRQFGNKIFLYGFLYFSTFCRNDCCFCQYRKSNTRIKRYRKRHEEVIETARQMAKAGVHLIDLTMGELDGLYHGNDAKAQMLFDLVQDVKESCDLPVMVSPGVVSDRVLEGLRTAGVDWYACYQETYNRRLFSDLRVHQDFNERLEKKEQAKALGLLIEEGILIGAGESLDDIVVAISSMRTLKPDQVRVMTLVPQPGTPMANHKVPDHKLELAIIALMRLVFQDSLIPASLDIDGLAGLQSRLQAGANVVTSLIPPGNGLGGVAHRILDIGQARRTPKAIAPILNRCDLKVASLEDYRTWIRQRHQEQVATAQTF